MHNLYYKSYFIKAQFYSFSENINSHIREKATFCRKRTFREMAKLSQSTNKLFCHFFVNISFLSFQDIFVENGNLLTQKGSNATNNFLLKLHHNLNK